MADRWTGYGGPQPAVANGWRLDTLVGPTPLWGANGILWSPGDELIVTQVFGAQVSAVDVSTGAMRPFAPQGEEIGAPDDGAFTADGTFFATEPPNGAVSMRRPDGTFHVLRDDLPGANGMAVSHDGRRLFVDEFRPGGRLLELDPTGERDPVVLADDLAMPNAFAMGPDGALWFPQVLAGEIWRYDLDSRSLDRRFTDLATPTAVKFDAAGRLLTSEGGSGRLTAIDLSTGSRTTLAQVNPGIDNFAVAPDGRLFVSHFTDGRLAEVTGGQERLLSPSGLIGPFGITRLPDGRCATADALAVNTTGTDGTTEVVASLLADLPGTAVDVAHTGEDLLILVGRGQVLRRSPDGTLRSVAGHLGGVTAMTEAPDGGAYVVDAAGGRVLHIDGVSDIVDVPITGLTDPRAVAVAPDGTIWVTHPGGATGFRDGRAVGTVGGVADPHGIGVDATTALIADPAHRRWVAADLASGATTEVVSDAPIGPPVAGTRMPHAFSPVHADGDGFLVGCDGDGSLRRLTRSANG
jgi:sugar lactone lactonase YvrE